MSNLNEIAVKTLFVLSWPKVEITTDFENALLISAPRIQRQDQDLEFQPILAAWTE